MWMSVVFPLDYDSVMPFSCKCIDLFTKVLCLALLVQLQRTLQAKLPLYHKPVWNWNYTAPCQKVSWNLLVFARTLDQETTTVAHVDKFWRRFHKFMSFICQNCYLVICWLCRIFWFIIWIWLSVELIYVNFTRHILIPCMPCDIWGPLIKWQLFL